ncbi:MAG: hypothetical protein AB7R55_00590 [Gemmatimonadales bacterium]
MTRPFFALLAALTAAPVCLIAQDSVDVRGHRVMGFDQELTRHQFLLYADGGAIDVRVKDPADRQNLSAVRSHLGHLPAMFGAGNFSMPMGVHAREVPGTARMTELRDEIRYQYVETELGGRVDIVTRDPAALAAVHEFLRFQIADHKTGDDTAVRPRPGR